MRRHLPPVPLPEPVTQRAPTPPTDVAPTVRRRTGWLVGLGAVIAALHLLGQGPLAAPPLTEPSLWAHWAAVTGPVAAAMALLRLVALAIGVYLWLVTLLALLATRSSSVPLRRLARAVTVPAARRLVFGAAGVGLTAAVALGPTALAVASSAVPRRGAAVVLPAAAQPPAGSGHATEHELPAPGPSSTTTPPAPRATSAPPRAATSTPAPGPKHQATEHELPAAPVPAPPATTAEKPSPTTEARPPTMAPAVSIPPQPAPHVSAARAPSTRPTQPASGAPASATSRSVGAASWTVAPGENFWFEAAQVLSQAWGRAPSDAEIVPYWHTLVEANRAALRDPANPDLIYPGQRFSVPAPPPAPR